MGRKVSLVRAVLYIAAQCLGAICGCGLVKSLKKANFNDLGGGATELADGFSPIAGLAAEIIGTFVLVYTVFSATDPKRKARDSHVPVSISNSYPTIISSSIIVKQKKTQFQKVLAPLPIGFAVFVVNLATIPVTGAGINPARSFGSAVMFNKHKAWDNHVLSLFFFSSNLNQTI